MPSERTPRQVAERTLILGTIAFRASLEVTDHPRALERSHQLLPWLAEIGCADELDPIERELLATPLGQLSASQKIDANWAGESAAFFGWMLNLLPPLEASQHANQETHLDVLRILRPDAAELLRSAALCDRCEIEDACIQFALIRSLLQESRVAPPAAKIVRRLNLQKLTEAGVAITEDALRRASETVAHMTPEQQSTAAGLYFVRHHDAMWYLSDRSTYFGA